LATKKRVKRRRWTNEWLLKRDVYTHLNLVSEIKGAEGEDFENYYRRKMSSISLIKIERNHQNILKSISSIYHSTQ
jgi:hypothetical protein